MFFCFGVGDSRLNLEIVDHCLQTIHMLTMAFLLKGILETEIRELTARGSGWVVLRGLVVV